MGSVLCHIVHFMILNKRANILLIYALLLGFGV